MKLITGLIVVLAIIIGVWGYNSWGIPTREYQLEITDKRYVPGQWVTRTSVDANGNSTTRQEWQPPEFYLRFYLEGDRLSCRVNKGKYDHVSIRDRVRVRAGVGRLFKRYLCKGVIG